MVREEIIKKFTSYLGHNPFLDFPTGSYMEMGEDKF